MQRSLLSIAALCTFSACTYTRSTSSTSTGAGAAAAVQGAPATGKIGNDIRWYRTAAEKRAAYVQGYRLAGERVAALSAGRSAGTWAVILDADETVLDNSRYQQERAVMDSGYTPTSWGQWIKRTEATDLPGAKKFIGDVRSLGGRVAIVTNRKQGECEDTRANLDKLEVKVDVVLCKDVSDDKNPRFAQVAAGVGGLPPLEVILWVGDNIQDFPGMTQDTMRAAPDSAFADFGKRFVLLPNPMYGSWEKNPLP
ncbi:MAG: hypothetical protein IBJ03_18275 [Gemmatimonadaceae bacterium]|nr:hypothetical protein [Gemmatimonadaceae bacterium]